MKTFIKENYVALLSFTAPTIAFFAIALVFLMVVVAHAADAPKGAHCNPVADLTGYYGDSDPAVMGDPAVVYHYSGDDAVAIVTGLTTYLGWPQKSVDKVAGSTNVYVGFDVADGSATLFFYGDNNCAFGYDDSWTIVDLTKALEQTGVRVEVGPGYYQVPGTPGGLDGFLIGNVGA